MTTRARDQRGAYSVLFALLAVVLLGVAALAVDLGNAYARKSDSQGQADFAALAGGQELSSTSGVVPLAVLEAVQDSLNKNSPLGDCDPCVDSPSDLIDGDFTNGEARFENGGLRVWTPNETVDYGFREEDGLIQSDATVGIFSPGTGALPMYAASGCDYGNQTLTDPAGGPAGPATASNLALGSAPFNNADIDLISTPNPPQIPVADPPALGPMLGLTGSGFHNPPSGHPQEAWVTKIGFFLEDGATYHVVDVVAGTRTNADVTIDNIPQAVASTEGLWWVRVFKKKVGDPDSAGAWSPVDEAVPLRVGVAVLECDSGASDGNFGTLRLPRTDVVSADELPVNMALSFQDPLSLAIHAGANATGLCTPGLAGAVESDTPNPGLMPGTNCVGTDPGLPANVATAGLITGQSTSMGYVDGRLDAGNNPTNSTCGRSDYVVDLGPKKYPVNNDTLSCFMTDGSPLSTITDPAYSGSSKLSEDIYLSPRFFWLPVLAVEPSSGASNRYSIIDFRPGFITDEGPASTKSSSNATSANGLIVQTTQVKQVKVVFFNIEALPGSPSGPVSDYLGVGPKVLRLID